MKTRSLLSLLAFAGIAFCACKKEYVGNYTLIKQVPEPAGEHCKSGGFRINSGIDLNGNKVLDSNEIQQTEYVCNGQYDKETIIYFPGMGYGYSTNTVTGSMYAPVAISNFDITNYPADSISFVTNLFTNNANVKAFVELYDQTNNKVIKNTTLSTNATTSTIYSTTVNFLNDLPKGPIKLNCNIRAEQAGTEVTFYLPTLKIYKK